MAVVWTNAELSIFETLRTNFSKIRIRILWVFSLENGCVWKGPRQNFGHFVQASVCSIVFSHITYYSIKVLWQQNALEWAMPSTCHPVRTRFTNDLKGLDSNLAQISVPQHIYHRKFAHVVAISFCYQQLIYCDRLWHNYMVLSTTEFGPRWSCNGSHELTGLILGLRPANERRR